MASFSSYDSFRRFVQNLFCGWQQAAAQASSPWQPGGHELLII